jgi:hypothetical protein
MKNITIALLATIISASSFAASCGQDAREIAKMNLDQVAKKYGFESADIGSSKFVGKEKVKISGNISEVISSYEVQGGIYKASYTVKVKVDESCAVRSVSVKEDAN